jgi:hypothetical protein
MEEKMKLEQANRDKACEQLSSEGRKHFDLIEFDANETLVTEIRKDPIGLFMIFLTGGLVLLVLLVVAIIVSSADLNTTLNATSANGSKGIIVMGLFILMLGTLVGTYIGAFIYRSNVIYVTSEKIAQVVYTSLFHRKISQLSIGDVQDVTVSQNGILAHIFKYGTLVVETSGEQANYSFSFVPEPYPMSKAIVSAHEENLKLYGN